MVYKLHIIINYDGSQEPRDLGCRELDGRGSGNGPQSISYY